MKFISALLAIVGFGACYGSFFVEPRWLDLTVFGVGITCLLGGLYLSEKRSK